ncbi:hypothetical protein F2P81_003139 [Scophthalmus maximus]|uniref:Uncharacterized protein n=1 Tax=Scophthalmus maximus TaxID=52904 RepID=A0A6A4TMD5_SCOMX|nr:hypothetical protein F2P81_003139 [Scophthalmus maximus]
MTGLLVHICCRVVFRSQRAPCLVSACLKSVSTEDISRFVGAVVCNEKIFGQSKPRSSSALERQKWKPAARADEVQLCSRNLASFFLNIQQKNRRALASGPARSSLLQFQSNADKMQMSRRSTVSSVQVQLRNIFVHRVSPCDRSSASDVRQVSDRLLESVNPPSPGPGSGAATLGVRG